MYVKTEQNGKFPDDLESAGFSRADYKAEYGDVVD
jgi:hypothetical protein